ncbi:recombinase family protein [Propionivibrio sp.]|uniref:recombinase family protein n=1 Tax=Propionivibrio sp. TaxID=2212460 RepID=UPI003BF0D117
MKITKPKLAKLSIIELCLAAIYARYSTADQKDTSIDDQIRRCREIAERHGATVPDTLIFKDAAVSGSDKGRIKRVGFDQLIAGIEAGEFSLLVVDELSRLARDVYELAKFDKLIHKHRVRVITADGLDSTSPTWTLQLSIIGAMAQFSLKETTHRVKRGMEGQLERGFMIAPPPFGYRATQETDAMGKTTGTTWAIQPEESKVVSQIFAWRVQGKSYSKIAKALNELGVRPGTHKRTREQTTLTPMWLQAAVYRIVENPIYKGLFMYRASATYLSRRAEAGLDDEGSITYARPQLAIVPDDVWSTCNDGKVSRSGYGGGRYLLAGLVTCGCCHSTLNVSSPSHGTRTLTCGSCNQEKAVGIRADTPGYVSVTGVASMLQTLIEANLCTEIQTALKSRLQDRLSGGLDAELVLAQVALSRAERICQRLAENMAQMAEDDPYLLPLFQKATKTRIEAEQTVSRLKNGIALIDTKALEAQLSIVDPMKIVELLFSENIVPVEHKRAILSRLFPRIVMRGKMAANETLFEIDMVPAGILAELTQTGVLIDDVVRYQLVLKCSAKRPTVWQVEYLTEDAMALAA